LTHSNSRTISINRHEDVYISIYECSFWSKVNTTVCLVYLDVYTYAFKRRRRRRLEELWLSFALSQAFVWRVSTGGREYVCISTQENDKNIAMIW